MNWAAQKIARHEEWIANHRRTLEGEIPQGLIDAWVKHKADNGRHMSAEDVHVWLREEVFPGLIRHMEEENERIRVFTRIK